MTLTAFMNLFDEFRESSWDNWRTVLARLTHVREFYAICGRGSGKSRIVALLATFFASREYRRAPGEFIYIAVFAPDRKQSAITFHYVVGLLKSVPSLAALIVAEQKDSIELTNGVVIEVISASIAAPRGRAYALAIVEEAALLPTDDSANPTSSCCVQCARRSRVCHIRCSLSSAARMLDAASSGAPGSSITTSPTRRRARAGRDA